jgi:hypothetical protein
VDTSGRETRRSAGDYSTPPTGEDRAQSSTHRIRSVKDILREDADRHASQLGRGEVAAAIANLL